MPYIDTKVYLQAEETPYGITKVHALDIPDTSISNQKVCIIDSGYDISHPDLPSDPNVVTGYTGPLSAGAWNYDEGGHGTHVAGTIAAIGGNGKGVVGVSRNGQLRLHIVKVFSGRRWAWGSTLVAAVEECVASGANIVNMSLGGPYPSQAARDAYDRIFYEENVLLVAAAGNGGNTEHSYPASYDSVMSVAGTDSNNNHYTLSQRNNQVDIAAPGVGVMSTVPRNVYWGGYASFSGTSMATPHVSGVAALVWSLNPGKSAADIREALEASAQDLGSEGRDDYFGHGLVRADKAMEFLGGGTEEVIVNFDEASSEWVLPYYRSDLEMENWYSFNAFKYYSSTGYNYGTKSRPNVGFNGWGRPMHMRCPGGKFNLRSIWLTPAWHYGVTFTLDGYTNGSLTATYSATIYSPSFPMQLNDELAAFTNIDSLTIRGSIRTQLAVDDMMVEITSPCDVQAFEVGGAIQSSFEDAASEPSPSAAAATP